MSKKAIANKQMTIPEYLKKDMDSNAGNENVTQDDILMPRIKLLQMLSPETQSEDAKYVEGAKKGMFFNTLTNALYEAPIFFVPFAYEMSYPVFRKRTSGGGLLGVFNSEKEAIEEIRLQENPNIYEVSQTAVHYGFVKTEVGQWEEVAIHMNSTKLTASRQLNSLIKLRGGARWTHIYQINNKTDENEKGKFQRLLVANAEGWPEAELVEKCRSYHEMFSNSRITTEHEGADEKIEEPSTEGAEF